MSCSILPGLHIGERYRIIVIGTVICLRRSAPSLVDVVSSGDSRFKILASRSVQNQREPRATPLQLEKSAVGDRSGSSMQVVFPLQQECHQSAGHNGSRSFSLTCDSMLWAGCFVRFLPFKSLGSSTLCKYRLEAKCLLKLPSYTFWHNREITYLCMVKTAGSV